MESLNNLTEEQALRLELVRLLWPAYERNEQALIGAASSLEAHVLRGSPKPPDMPAHKE